MLDINNPVQWQLKDDKHPVLMPWYSHGMLNELKTWDLSDKVVLEWGGGWSSIYYAFYAKEVYVIETDVNWAASIVATAYYLGVADKLHVFNRQVNEGDQSKVEYFTQIPTACIPDIVVVDSILRHECLEKAVSLPKRPLTIIHDNWQQDGFLCPASVELMKPYEIHNFIQEDHTDNHGNKWATAYWNI